MNNQLCFQGNTKVTQYTRIYIINIFLLLKFTLTEISSNVKNRTYDDFLLELLIPSLVFSLNELGVRNVSSIYSLRLR